jgi:hypothetical protein
VSGSSQFGHLTPKIVALHELLDSAGVPHQFGGAIALIWYRNPRATTDIDVNLTVPPEAASPVLGLLPGLGVTVTADDREAIALDGQARLDWEGSYLDVFFATLDFHYEMMRRARQVAFGPVTFSILAPEHLIVCKAVFDRPKDWLDIEEMLRWGTVVDGAEVLRWIDDILGPDRRPLHERRPVRLPAELQLGAAPLQHRRHAEHDDADCGPDQRSRGHQPLRGRSPRHGSIRDDARHRIADRHDLEHRGQRDHHRRREHVHAEPDLRERNHGRHPHLEHRD